jgi:hypothetical protein
MLGPELELEHNGNICNAQEVVKFNLIWATFKAPPLP